MKNEQGVSLIELLLVILIISSAVLLIANLPNALLLVTKSKQVSLAKEIATKQIEDKRTISFSNLVNDTVAINDIRINMLPQGSGTTVVVDCDSSICTNGEHVKKITVTVSWKQNNKPQIMTLTTLIGEGGINQ